MSRYHPAVLAMLLTCGFASAQGNATPYATLQHAGTVLPVARAAPPSYESSLGTALPVTQSEMKIQQYGPGYYNNPSLIAAQAQSPAGAAPGAEGDGSGSGESGGASAAQAVNPAEPLAQIQLQNYFQPKTYNARGYANTFILQPVIPINLNSELFPFHIIRPTLPLIGGPDGVKGGVGDLTIVDVFVHPIKEIKTSVGGGYIVIVPTATDADLGQREWFLGPSLFAITTAAPKWVIGALVQAPFSLQSNSYQVQMQPILNRLFPGEWYVGWGHLHLE